MNFSSVLFILLLAGSLAMFAYSVRRLLSFLHIGKSPPPETRTGSVPRRLVNVLVVALGQSKLLREPVAGVMHFFIFWGFVVLLVGVVESICQGIYPSFSLAILGPLYPPLVFIQDIFGLLVACSVLFAIFRRYVLRPKRLEVSGHARMDATLILLLIFLIMCSMFAQNAAALSCAPGATDSPRVISSALSGLFSSLPQGQQESWFNLFWWVHILLVLGFLNYLPFSKHLHIISSIPNVYLAKLSSRGSLRALNLQDETLAKFGASDVEDLSWKQLLDGYTCTECGRCTAACPAAITGKPLSPKKIIVDIRRRLLEKAAAGIKSEAKGDAAKQLLMGGYITDDEIWACTTCMACLQECPVQIEHIDAIVDMRRYLVLSESNFPKEMQLTFQNLERNFTPWGFSHSSRADWSQGLNIPLMSEKPDAKILFWVGCAGAYDERYKKVSRSFARLMQIAGVDFAILGTEEKCTGDPARRAGNEYLAQMLMAENMATFNKYGVKKIVTSCPHCFNILKNEYPQLSGCTYDVSHHSEFLLGLVESGKIKLTKETRSKIVYHDSCYLGRYNQIYEGPRRAIKLVPGSALLPDMKRSADRGFCCGAGGARMFMEEKTGKRVNIERTEEALTLNPDVIGTACPFCMTMLSDGLKEKEGSGRVQVKDIAELILGAVEG